MINDQFTFSSIYFQTFEFYYKEVIELVWGNSANLTLPA